MAGSIDMSIGCCSFESEPRSILQPARDRGFALPGRSFGPHDLHSHVLALGAVHVHPAGDVGE